MSITGQGIYIPENNTANLDDILDGTISGEYINDRITKTRYYAFAACSNLVSVKFGNLTSLAGYTFASASGLIRADLPKATSIGTAAFRNLSSFNTLILRSSTQCSLANVSALEGTPFRNGTGGTVYVPANLVSSYQSSTNWTSLESTTFAAIEGSVYE